MTPVQDTVAVNLVREHLAGLRGYNPMPQAEGLLARTLQSSCVSVSHAEAVVRTFDDQCPTPKIIKEVALNLRERFMPKQPPQEEQWRKEYGPPDKAWSDSMLNVATGVSASKAQFKAELNRLRTQSIKDALAYERDVIDIRGGKDRAFWSDHLRWLEANFPEQVAAVRAGREPVFPEYRSRKATKATPINTEGFDSPILKPITAESFEGVTPITVRRCPTCGGSGRLAGDDWCNDCQLGKDLRRIEGGNEGYAIDEPHDSKPPEEEDEGDTA